MIEHITRLKCDVKGCNAVIEVESYPDTEGDYGYDGYNEKWIERSCIGYDLPKGWSGPSYDLKCPQHGEKS